MIVFYIFQIFDIKKFESFVKSSKLDSELEKQRLFYKACVRIALVKDGIELNKTPCWFMIINIIALEMVRERIIDMTTNIPPMITTPPTIFNNNSIPNPNFSNYASPELAQLIFAMQQHQLTLQPQQPLDMVKLASLASSIASNNTTQKRRQPSIKKRLVDSSDSDVDVDISSEDSVVSSATSEKDLSCCSSSMSSDSRYKARSVQRVLTETKSMRPRLDTMLKMYDEKKSASLTSGYDSAREQFDSWSSAKTKSDVVSTNILK